MRYTPGKTYMHPNLPLSILDEIRSCLVADPDDLAKMQKSGDTAIIEYLHLPKPSTILDTSEVPKEAKRTRYVFKRRVFAFHFWECERVEELG